MHALETDHGAVSESFAKLVGHVGDVEELSWNDFDPRAKYDNVRDAVKTATGGEVKVFCVGTGKAKVEYWVVGVDGKDKKVTGVRARAVES